MATRDDLEGLIEGKNALARLARRDLHRFWARLDPNDPDAWIKVEQFLAAITDQYGRAASAIAADWFDSVRPASLDGYRATVDRESAREAVRRAQLRAQHLMADNPTTARDVIATIASEWVNRAVNRTLWRSAEADPGRPRLARVPRGSKTCAWCLMLASQGAVYATEGAALAASHSDCDCILTPLWDSSPWPRGYDPSALYDVYAKAADAAGGTDASAVLSYLRAQQGIH